MGSLEDRYRREQRQEEDDRVREVNRELDEALAMIPKVDANLLANPPSSHDIAWLRYEGEVRVVWKVGTYRGPSDVNIDMCLIPQEKKLVTAGSGWGHSPDNPFETWAPLVLIPARTVNEARTLRHKLHPLSTALISKLPHEKKSKRRFRLW